MKTDYISLSISVGIQLYLHTIYRVFRQNYVSPNSLQPIPPLHITSRDIKNSQRNVQVYSRFIPDLFHH